MSFVERHEGDRAVIVKEFANKVEILVMDDGKQWTGFSVDIELLRMLHEVLGEFLSGEEKK